MRWRRSSVNEIEKKKLLSMLGLCARARKLTMGTDQVVDAIKKRSAGRKKQHGIVFIASDTAKNTRKRMVDACTWHGVMYAEIEITKDEFAHAVGKSADCAVCGVFEESFLKAVCQILDRAGIRPITTTEKKNTVNGQFAVGGNEHGNKYEI